MALPQIGIGDGLLGNALLSSVEVVQELNRHWQCTVVCRQTQEERVPIENLLGQPVTIHTTDEDGASQLHFSGFIYDVALRYEVWGSYTATLLAVSDSYVLDIAAHKQYYAEGTLSSLSGILAGRSGVSIAVNAPAGKALNYVQYGETDFSFLSRIVDDAGAWLRPCEGGLEVFASFQGGSTLAWRDHQGLTFFTLKARLVQPGFSGSHYDHHAMASKNFTPVVKQPALFDGGARMTSAVQAASQQLPPGFEPQRARAMTLDQYEAQLGGESERAMGSAVTGRGESRSQKLRAGDTVAISGTLDAAGTYGLIQVEHRWTPQGYTNQFVCTPWTQYRNPHPPAMRQWEGVVPARVVAHNDPKKMGRLKVQFFWQQDGPTHWSRMVSPHAGSDRGMMFMPEIGDEVAVMFEDGDPERPIIVGSLWNGVQQAPRAGFFAPEADIPDNNVKRILTKSGNRLQMIDTPQQETVVVATPHHTRLRMTEKDGDTTRPLFEVHSDGDIVLSAPQGRIHLYSKFTSKEVGEASEAGVSAAAPLITSPALSPAAEKESGVAGFFGGLYDSTLKPLAHMVAHPIETVEGIGHAVAHPISTAKVLGHAISTTAQGVMSGDGRSMGTALGSVGMLFIPGAGEADVAEDAARLGQVGELGEVADVGSTVSKGVSSAGVTPTVESVSKEAEIFDSGRLPATTLTKEGWPDLPARQAPNFVSADPVTLNPGETVFRIIDDPSNAGGGYWARELPNNTSEWRSNYAVEPGWNNNGLYVEHVVEDPLNVWEGPASTQGALTGGSDQIWMPPGTLNPTNVKPTGW